jgi:hypothetical protein
MGQERLVGVGQTVWLTRDSEDGSLSDVVEIWFERPDPTCNEGVVIWFHSNGPSVRMSASDAAMKYRTIPDHALQCVRIG